MSSPAQVLSAPEVAAAPSRGWREALSAAASVVVGDVSLWVLGALGFMARGGLVLMTVPILTVPSPVLLSVLFKDEITTSGLADSIQVVAWAVGICVGLLLIAALLAGAYAEVASFERTVNDPETEVLRDGAEPRSLGARERRGLVLRLAALGGVGLLPVLVVAGIVGQGISQVTIQELQFPGNLADPLVVRVVGRIEPELIVLLVVTVIADILVTRVSRQVLAMRFGVSPTTSPRPVIDGDALTHDARAALVGLGRAFRQPFRTVATAGLCWLVSAVILLPAVWATALAWSEVRDLFLTAQAADLQIVLNELLGLLLFTVVWTAGLVLAGFASALRAALWTADTLR